MTENNDLLNLSNDPFFLFTEWFAEASKKEINDPNAMNLSTISDNFRPNSRMVLLKQHDNEGFVFYTNIKSKKGKSIKINPFVSLNFHWKSLLRQVRIEGKAEQVPDKEADEYFNSRPEESKLGAWASNQSEELKKRKNLEDNINFYKIKFNNQIIQRPHYWTGFKVKPDLIEFWQDMPFRLHDRLEFRKIDNKWNKRKLYP